MRSSAEEALALGTSMGQPALTAPPLAWLTLLAALQGRDDYDALCSDLEEVVAAHPLGILTDPVHDLTRWAKGARAAGAADTFGALHHLSPLPAPRAGPHGRRRADRRSRPRRRARPGPALGRGARHVRRCHRQPWALATVDFGRAITGDPASAERVLRARWPITRGPAPPDAARVRLAYGEWLRRSQRRIDARQHLRQALDTFRDVHAEAVAARANQELRASGETARKRDPSTLVKLTPTELQVAQLVGSGLSNKDVAAQCWISPRTVAFHLRNVFAKAGITSRGELARLDLG